MRYVWGTAAAVCLLVLPACVPRHAPEPDAFAKALGAADQLWAARADAGSVDAAERAYTALLADRPDSPEVRWRLARSAWSRSLIEPANASTWHTVGREYALGCFNADPAMIEALAKTGDRLTEALLGNTAVPAECLVFGAAHIVALVELRGAGAALDLEDAGPLLAHAAASAPAVEAALREWALGRAMVLAAGPPAEARAHLNAAIEAEPGLRFFREDAAAAFPDLAGTWGAAAADPRWTLENGAPP